jgi:hypothetical protein
LFVNAIDCLLLSSSQNFVFTNSGSRYQNADFCDEWSSTDQNADIYNEWSSTWSKKMQRR